MKSLNALLLVVCTGFSFTAPAATIASFDGGADTAVTLQRFGELPGASIQASGGVPGGYLQLTAALNSQNNWASFDQTDGGPFVSSRFSFQFRIEAPVTPSADGFSFSYANTANFPATGALAGAPFTPEDPAAAGVLGFGFDTWSNGAPNDDPGQPQGSDYSEISVFYNGALISRVNNTRTLPTPLTLDDGNWHTASGEVNFQAGTVDLSVDNQPIFNDLAVPGLASFDSRIIFGGRTGGENELVGIDNLNVTWTPVGLFCADFNDNQVPPGTMTSSNIAGAGYIAGGVLHLTDGGINSACGTFVIPDPSGGATINSLYASWKSLVGGGAAGADGYSFNWAADASLAGCPTPYTQEDGTGTGLSVTLDTFDNTGNGCDDCPTGEDYGLEIRWRGQRVAYEHTDRSAANPGKDFLRKNRFVDVEVQVTPAGQATFNYDGLLLSAALPDWGAGITAGNFVFAARTGGANDNHWIDDLQINCFTPGPAIITSNPQDATVPENQPASFRAEVNGTPPYSFQWQLSTDGGGTFANIAGATSRSYLIAVATAADHGKKFRFIVSNASGSATSTVATLTVQVNPRVVGITATPNDVVIQYSRPVDLGSGTYSFDLGLSATSRRYGSDHSVVILSLDAALAPNTPYTLTIQNVALEGGPELLITPNPTVKTIGFGGQFCANFDDNQLPPGTMFTGTLSSIENGYLHLTDAFDPSACGGFYIPAQAPANLPLSFMAISWRSYVGDGGGGGADGYSLSWGSDVTPVCSSEAGQGSGLIVQVDTFDNGCSDCATGDDYGIEILYRGVRVASDKAGRTAATPTKDFLRKSRFVDASVIVDQGRATFTYDGLTISGPLPNFGDGIAGGNFAFSGRVGGANDNQWVDDLKINCFTPGPVSVVSNPQDVTVLEGQPASFSVAADGTPPFSYQWQVSTDGGSTFTDIPGATSSSYSIASVAEANGGQYRAVVSNLSSSANSAAATLTVLLNPRILGVTASPIEVTVKYSRPVELSSGTYTFDLGLSESSRRYGADHSIVIVTPDAQFAPNTPYSFTIENVAHEGQPAVLQIPNPDVRTIGFGLPFCANFDDNLVPGGTMTLSNMPNAGYIGGGVLHLTDDGVGSACGGFWVPNQSGDAPLSFMVLSWKSLIGGVFQAGESTQFGQDGADGYSVNWGSDVTPTCVGEAGIGTNLIVSIDTFDNGAGEPAPGLEIRWRNRRVAGTLAVPGDSAASKTFLRKNRFVGATLAVDGGNATLTYDGIVIGGPLPGFGDGILHGNFSFGGRTGGAHDNQWIDDLRINCFAASLALVDEPDDAVVPEGATATFTAEVDGIPPYTYQWTRNGVVVSSGSTHAVSLSYTTPATTEADDGAKYQLQVSNAGGSVTTREANLDVVLNPQIAEVSSSCPDRVQVNYDRPVQLPTGTYTLLAGGTPLLCNDFNSNDGGFTVETPIAYDGPWAYSPAAGAWQQQGQGPENQHANTSLLTSPAVPVSGLVTLTFVHRYSFEGGFWDGGQVRVSVNGGAFTAVPGSAFTTGGYNGTVLGNSVSLLAGQQAYVENSPDFANSYVTSEAILGPYNAGDTIRIQFIAASDTNTRGQFSPNWEINSVCLTGTGAIAVQRAYGATHNEVILTSAQPLTPGQVYTLEVEGVIGENGDPVLPSPTRVQFTATADTTPPTITCPPNVIAPATSTEGGPATYPPPPASDNCGPVTVVCVPASGAIFPIGDTTVTCTATDGSGNTASCSFTVTITGGNEPPVCVAGVGPAECIINVPGDSAAYALSLDGEQGCVVLDATGSSDPDGDALTYAWTLATIPVSLTPDQEPNGGGTGSGSGTVTLSGNTLAVSVTFSGLSANTTAAHIHGPAGLGTNAGVLYPLTLIPAGSTAGVINQTVTLANGTGGFTIAQQLQQLRDGLWYINIHSTAHPGGEIRGQLQPTSVNGALAGICLPLGCHAIVLSVSDGQAVSTCSLTVCVIGAGDAVQQCIDLVDDSDLGRNNKRPLIASLKAAQASFDRGNIVSAANQLKAFANKVRAQIAPDNPAAAAALIECAENIIGAVDCAAALGE